MSSAYAYSPLVLVNNGQTQYRIVIAYNSTPAQTESAALLQRYIKNVTGAQMPIVTDREKKAGSEMILGKTNRKQMQIFSSDDQYKIEVEKAAVFLNGSGVNGPLYAVYAFVEKFLGCRRYAADFEFVPIKKTITLPSDLKLHEKPDFRYREVYYPDSENESYLNWHRLTRIDENWGLWGHSFNKLVPAREYFEKHPEYYALVDGKRKDSQLCLSNPQVFKILLQNLKSRMSESPSSKYWSVSQNDDLGYCECALCKAVDKKEGGPQGSILKFVNRVAERFPDKIISTLAYTYSQRAPLFLKPLPNVQIMLCSIDCNRSKTIEKDPASAGFRRDLYNWSRITRNLFVWDYEVQFTNYMSPFPNWDVLQSNLKFFKANKVKGLFLQGSGDTPAEFSEFRGYLLAKLSWNVDEDIEKVKDDFLQGYYGKAGKFIKKYIDLLSANLRASGKRLDIYGSPVHAYNSYLSPSAIEEYGLLFDQAEDSVATNPTFLAHVKAARLPLEFAVLEQSKFYGIEKHGIFELDKSNGWAARAAVRRKVQQFTQTAEDTKVSKLSEVGISPRQYEHEWNAIFTAGPKTHLALNAKVISTIPFSDEYQNKGARTLTDGSRGYLDYQYNWLGWYGTNMEVIVDLGSTLAISEVKTSFLEDQRHWAFPPDQVIYSFSTDGVTFSSDIKVDARGKLYENYEKSVQDYRVALSPSINVRYIKVTAGNLKELPAWRFYKNRKAWLFADEIMIN